MRTLALHGKPTLEIELDQCLGAQMNWITSYSTMDVVEGTLFVTATHDTPFHDIEICFTGESRAFVDRLTTTPPMSGRTESVHRFLNLKQPIEDAELPLSKKLLAGNRYSFRFTFTIPAHLLPRSCSHSVSNDSVRDQHLLLPPSMGDPDVAGFGTTLLDDLAPEMAKVVYAVKARVIQKRPADGSLSLLAEKVRKLRVKPAFEEQPPLTIGPTDLDYRLRQEKTIKKGLFKGKLGTLTAQTAQPKPLMIPGARSSCNAPISTITKVILRFDPADEANPPPRLGSLTSRIKASTYYASAPMKSFPGRANTVFESTQGAYAETLTLSTLCVASAQWTKHTAASGPCPGNDRFSALRRDSGISDCSTNSSDDASFHSGILNASKGYKGNTFYTAEIIVPVTLPMNKNFLPTFHTCLISRTYTLSLQLSVHTKGVGGPSLLLKVPVQICAEGSDTGNENARVRQAETLASPMYEADEMFIPRSIAPPAAEAGGDTDLPPEYATLSPQATARIRTNIWIAV